MNGITYCNKCHLELLFSYTIVLIDFYSLVLIVL